MGNPKTGGAKMSKTADEHFCSCGGTVKVFFNAAKGKVRPFARCMKCNTEKRRPSEFKE
jgi:hypothetical protein